MCTQSEIWVDKIFDVRGILPEQEIATETLFDEQSLYECYDLAHPAPTPSSG